MNSDDKQQVLELLNRSAYALDTKNLPMIEGCFAPEAVFVLEIAGVAEVSRFEGREAIMGLMSGALEAQTDERKHAVTNAWFREAGADSATVVSYLTLTATEHGEINLITTGVYTDTAKRSGGEWAITERQLQLDRPY